MNHPSRWPSRKFLPALVYRRLVFYRKLSQELLAVSSLSATMFNFVPLAYHFLLAITILPVRSSPITHQNGTILTFSLPICVDANEHAWWAKRSGPTTNVGDCYTAMNKLAQQAQENFFTEYDFYSSPMIPSPFNGYPLPQSASHG